MEVDDIRAFIPSKDYENSKTFYTDLGFTGTTVSDDLTLFESGKCTFLCNDFTIKDLLKT
jgi:predicted lactoylglutathione lyase